METLQASEFGCGETAGFVVEVEFSEIGEVGEGPVVDLGQPAAVEPQFAELCVQGEGFGGDGADLGAAQVDFPEVREPVQQAVLEGGDGVSVGATREGRTW